MMKKLLLLLFISMCSIGAFAQFGLVQHGPISGGCNASPQLGIDIVNNVLYSCGESRAWNAITGGGSGPVIVVPGVNGNMIFNSNGVLGATPEWNYVPGGPIHVTGGGQLDLIATSVLGGLFPPAANNASPILAGALAFDYTTARLVTGDSITTQIYTVRSELCGLPTGTGLMFATQGIPCPAFGVVTGTAGITGAAGQGTNIQTDFRKQTGVIFSQSPYNILITDQDIFCDATGGAIQMLLPPATGTGRLIRMKKVDATNNNCQLVLNGADTADGQTVAVPTVRQYAHQDLQDLGPTFWMKMQVVAMGGILTGNNNNVLAINTGIIGDLNGNKFLAVANTPNAVDGMCEINAATANPALVVWGACGTDTNIGLNITSVAGGTIFFNGLQGFPQNFNLFCTGVIGTANATNYLLAPGPSGGITCSSNSAAPTQVGQITVGKRPITCTNLYVTASAAGATAGSGIVTVLKNGNNTTALTCTLGTGTTCSLAGQSVGFSANDSIGVEVLTGQATDTTSTVKANISCDTIP